MTAHEQLPRIGGLFTREAFKSGGLTSACHAQQSKTLTVFEAKTQIIDCFWLIIVALRKLRNFDRTCFWLKLDDTPLFSKWILIFNFLKSNQLAVLNLFVNTTVNIKIALYAVCKVFLFTLELAAAPPQKFLNRYQDWLAQKVKTSKLRKKQDDKTNG